MINKVDKNLGVLVGVQNFTRGDLSVILESSEEVVGSNISTRVGDNGLVVNVSAIGMVVKLSREGIPVAAGDIIVHHQDNVFSGNAIGYHDLVCVSSISLMSVVRKPC